MHKKTKIFCNTQVPQLFYHSITEFLFLMNILGKRSDLPFSRKSDRKKEKSTVSFTHEQNIICSQTQLDSIAHEQTIICRQLFAGHVVASWPMKRKKNLLRMIRMMKVCKLLFAVFLSVFAMALFFQMYSFGTFFYA